ncbi:putative methyltransferase PMT10 [Camellia lanceoleosa]|uniref:Methyltransferase PMT10 n=1 Tax=Camellia lanceoleosa TaxID=1840588 RepID=A0ACC0HMM3_9ERIC|nr:putative methyltransferase PMT10 [Camellia lanceoleosa]
MRLVEDKGDQNWISRKNNKFIFPGGGTQFINGADQYLDHISNVGYLNTRVALDVGCGVASFGAYLLGRNVTTLSIAPKDVHENQIQFALERDGILLLEVNRMPRAGGQFVWAAQSVYEYEDKSQEQWKEMGNLSWRICWELIKREGFAAALHDYGIDCWVMNVVPVSGFNTSPVIYGRGLVGVMHDWYVQCTFSTSG